METTLAYYHLGSWTTITDGKGSIEREQSFDAWGKMRDPYTWREFPSGGTRPQGPMFDRGFTGHEHLFEFGLINMNGRMYDPIMSSFLSVDNYVQSPDNSQNFNRYAYCMNNPLRYTDPSGEIVWEPLLIGALCGGMMNLIFNGDNVKNFGQGLAYFGIGALAGAMSAGVAGGISSALWEGSFSAGFWGSAAAKTALSSFQTGSIIGASSGFTGSFITATGNSWMKKEGFLKGLGKGIVGGLIGAGSGYLLGGLSGGIDAVHHNRDFRTGDILSPQEKLDVMVGVHKPELDAVGNPDATIRSARNIVTDGVEDYGVTIPGDMNRSYIIENGKTTVNITYNNNEILIRNDRIEQMWNGDKEALETLFHEWYHGVQFHEGEYGALLNTYNNNFQLVKDLMEYNAYTFDFLRTGSSYRLDRMLYHGFGRKSLLDAFRIKMGMSPLYH